MLKSLIRRVKDAYQDEYTRHRLSDRIQVAFVATFWVGFFAVLMIYAKNHPVISDAHNAGPVPRGMAAKFQ